MAEENKDIRKHRTMLYNILFLAAGTAIVLFLLAAPPETTVKLPHDGTHEKFFSMHKKEAEKFCEKCHSPDGECPLSEDHPPKYRCLFCHKRQ
jgi:hypothetical protein